MLLKSLWWLLPALSVLWCEVGTAAAPDGFCCGVALLGTVTGLVEYVLSPRPLLLVLLPPVFVVAEIDFDVAIHCLKDVASLPLPD